MSDATTACGRPEENFYADDFVFDPKHDCRTCARVLRVRGINERHVYRLVPVRFGGVGHAGIPQNHSTEEK